MRLLESISTDDESTFERIIGNIDLLFREARASEQSIKNLTQQLESSRAELDRYIAANISGVKNQSEKVDELQTSLAAMETELSNTRIQKSSLEAELSNLRTQLMKATDTTKPDEYLARIASLENSISMLKAKLKDEQARPDYTEELKKLRLEKMELEAQARTQTNQFTPVDTSLADKLEAQVSTFTKQNQELRDTIANKNEQLRLLTGEIAKLRSQPQFTSKDRDVLENRIKDLQGQLEIATRGKLTSPVITQALPLTCENITVFREIKHCIYMNSLIEYVAQKFALNNTDSNCESRKFLLVLDHLDDEHKVQKYRKHEFPINQNYSQIGSPLPLLITNKTENEIMQVVDLSDYDYIVVIDRLHFIQCAVKRSNTHIYYSIDSETDTVDFNLQRSRCVGYFKYHTPAELQKFDRKPVCDFYIDPTSVTNLELDPTKDDISFMMSSVDFVERILCNASS